MATEWKRPESVPFPSVWRRFETADPVDKSRIRKFRVQDATEDMHQPIILHMKTYFVRDEPSSKSQNVLGDAVSLAEFGYAWGDLLKQNCVLVCLEEDENREVVKDKHGVVVIVGCNLTNVKLRANAGEEAALSEVFQGECIRMQCRILGHILKEADVFNKYNLDIYMYSNGLSVDPSFRRMGIGMEILRSRDALAKAIGIEATANVFSGEVSQRMADKLGFEVLFETGYIDLLQIDPECVLPGLETKRLKIMGKRFPQ